LVVLAPTAPAEAAFPGANGKIAFWKFQGNSPDIYAVNTDGSGLERLTNSGLDYDPAWSADGRQIAFTRATYPGASVSVMNADGTGRRSVAGLNYGLGQPAWSPFGTELAISASYTEYNDLFRVRVDSPGATPIKLGFGPNFQAAWSPDPAGRLIAFVHLTETNRDINVIGANGAGQVNLTPTPDENEMAPNWSPDAWFIVMGDDFNGAGVRIMDADGSNRHVVPDTRMDRNPAFSPDGTKLVAETWLPDVQYTQLVTYDLTGAGRTLIPGTEHAQGPDWQPIPGPKRSDYKNAAQFCKAQRDFLGEAKFRQQYGGGANAFGGCVSSN
jgi:TolB protein